MNGIPTLYCIFRNFTERQHQWKGIHVHLSRSFSFLVFLTSCSFCRWLPHNSTSSWTFHKLSVSSWLTVPACSSCSLSTEFTRLRLAHLEVTSLMTPHRSFTVAYREYDSYICGLKVQPGRPTSRHKHCYVCVNLRFHFNQIFQCSHLQIIQFDFVSSILTL